MARFIEEFYYGNIVPQARSTKQMKVWMKTKNLLTNALANELKK